MAEVQPTSTPPHSSDMLPEKGAIRQIDAVDSLGLTRLRLFGKGRRTHYAKRKAKSSYKHALLGD